ncbi:helix-turn-helix transcriptional regulator [Brevibacillus sp. AG]|uniref:helix-turn-helix transcriptional regulator n=1 Tax=Brevibacillus sp. AG TaxID=3020891 RepID=UPI00232F661E|nr:helix-turn-helix transcriptional regulator [Brevibacillus sp. AG]MDC0760579.1 helix-turn-helix transcriptional regulator [Brevibacillus sp. AG]
MKNIKARSTLIKARKEKKMTQQEVANAVGINRAFLANIERGEHTPSLEVAHKISLVLESNMETLFFNHDVRKTNTA